MGTNNPDDFNFTTTSLAFGPSTLSGATATGSLEILNDTVVETDEDVDFEISNLDDGLANGSDDLDGIVATSEGAVTITDDDMALSLIHI